MKKRVISKKIIAIVIISFCFLSSSNVAFSKQSDFKNPNQIFVELSDFVGPVALQGFPSVTRNLDPALTYNSYSIGFNELVYEGLVTYDKSSPNLIVPYLANSWNISTNGTVYTFYLKHNIHYQDGSQFNAYTMKYSLDRMILIDYGGGPSHFLTEQIVGAENFYENKINMSDAKNYLQAGGVTVLDEYTLQIKLVHPFEPFLDVLTFCSKAVSPYSIISNLPSEYNTNQDDILFGMISLRDEFPSLTNWTMLGLENNHDPGISGIVPKAVKTSINPWMGANMVGTGPYIENSSSLTQITFIKNEKWWGTFAPNAPDSITYTEQTDSQTRIAHFLNGQTDILNLDGLSRDEVFTLIDTNGNSITKSVNAYKNTPVTDELIAFNFNSDLGTYIKPDINISSTWNLTHIIDDNLIEYSTNSTLLASLNNPFTALKFREAFSYAFNYNVFLNDEFYHIFASKPNGIIPSPLVGYQNNLQALHKIPDYNLTKAKQLFNEVGWRGNINIYDSPLKTGELLLQDEINNLNVGININLINQNPDFTQNPVSYITWKAYFDSSYGFVYGLINKNGFYPRFYTFYDNPSVNQLMNKSIFETNNINRAETFKNLTSITTNDFESINIAELSNYVLVHNWLQNFGTTGSQGPFDNIPDFQFISNQNLQTTPTTTTIQNTTASSNHNTSGFLIVNSMVVLFIIYAIKKRKNAL